MKEFISPALSFPEGPVLLGDMEFLVVEMGEDAGTLTRVDGKNGTKRRIVRTGRPNGLALDRNGIIWTAESDYPSLLKVSMNGDAEVFVDNYGGEPFRFPNDLAFGPDGLLYMTDSGIRFKDSEKDGKISDDYATYPYKGRVFAIDTATKEMQLIDDDIKFTNGIAFGPDGCLYVNETRTGNIYRYEKAGGRFGDRILFANVNHEGDYKPSRGPDGMKFSKNGNLYCTVYDQGDVVVINPEGKVIDSIKTKGMRPTNLVFGPEGSGDIYVTEVSLGSIERFHVGEDGLPLYN